MEVQLVQIENNQVVVGSRQIAEDFEKQHKHVLDSIRDILAAENSATKFFYESTYDNLGKEYPEYLMNRDGFSLLVMGFTGKEALNLKIRYIQAFNEMQAKLEAKRLPCEIGGAFNARSIQSIDKLFELAKCATDDRVKNTIIARLANEIFRENVVHYE